MAFVKVTPINEIKMESALAGAPPKVTYEDGEPVVINTDFVLMISEADREAPEHKDLPADTVVLLVMNIGLLPVRGSVEDLRRRFNKVKGKKVS